MVIMAAYTYDRRIAASELGPMDVRKVKTLLSTSAHDLKEIHGLLREVWGQEQRGSGRAIAVSHASTAYVTVKNLLEMLDDLNK